MIGLIAAIIVFNIIAFKTNKRLTTNQIVHIWAFTIAFQMSFDLYVDVKYQAYWYFTKSIEWRSIPAHTVLLPPINMMFLNWYPFNMPMNKQIRYFLYWLLGMLSYEIITMLPEPWGYFHYEWWNLWYSAMIDPILLVILLLYYKWVRKMEKNICD